MSDALELATPDEWIVGFEPRTSIWWNRFLAVGFGHCFAFGWTPHGWVYVEPLIRGTMVGIIPESAVHAFFTQAKIGDLKLLAARPESATAVRPRFMVTCAGCIGSVLGLKRLPITPAGLYWTLRRMGARRIGRAIDEPPEEMPA